MVLKVPDIGERAFLDAVLVALGATWLLRLYVNAHVPTDGDLLANYTEATFAGYAAAALGPWAPAGTDAQGRAWSESAPKTFTATAGSAETVRGYYVTSGTGALLWAEAADVPLAMDAAGKKYSVIPRLTLKSEF